MGGGKTMSSSFAFRLLFVLALLTPGLSAAQIGAMGAAGFLEGFGKGMADAARQWGEYEHEKALIERRYQLEEARVRAQYERELARQVAEAERHNREVDRQRAEQQKAEKQRAEIAALQEQLARIEAERAKFEEDRAVAKVEAAHPGWIATIRMPQFLAWKAVQPASVQTLATSERPEDAILMLDLFKRDQAMQKPRTAQKKK